MVTVWDSHRLRARRWVEPAARARLGNRDRRACIWGDAYNAASSSPKSSNNSTARVGFGSAQRGWSAFAPARAFSARWALLPCVRRS
eukprot:347246-Chlamydomonas_euryale.AAC.2